MYILCRTFDGNFISQMEKFCETVMRSYKVHEFLIIIRGHRINIDPISGTVMKGSWSLASRLIFFPGRATNTATSGRHSEASIREGSGHSAMLTTEYQVHHVNTALVTTAHRFRYRCLLEQHFPTTMFIRCCFEPTFIEMYRASVALV